jgi:hypothetical protein
MKSIIKSAIVTALIMTVFGSVAHVYVWRMVANDCNRQLTATGNTGNGDWFK